MKLLTFIKSNEFFTYFIIGGISTIIDWTIFWLFLTQINAAYPISLIVGYVTASLFHYVANKILTFGCQSKKIRSQFSLHFLVTFTSLLCSLGVMSLLVSGLNFNKLYARILTTIVLLFPNYLLHKYLTFSKKIFFSDEIKISQ